MLRRTFGTSEILPRTVTKVSLALTSWSKAGFGTMSGRLFREMPWFGTHTNTTGFFISDSFFLHFVMNLIVLRVTNL